MKHLLTISALLISSLAMGQWPSLPYNPDDNADGLIGVADLQTLLSNYGSEFASAVVSEDGESAIVYMGDMTYPQCKYSCDQLPGFWALPELEDLVPVWDEVGSPEVGTITWLQPLDFLTSSFDTGNLTPLRFRYFYSGPNGIKEECTQGFVNPWRCYCAAKQLPRVEYATCTNTNINTFRSCCEERVAEGWLPLGGISMANKANSPYSQWAQSFWRWAE
jgi:hypothetical protein